MTTPFAVDRLRGEVQAVIARHDTRGHEDFSGYAGRPVAFMQEVLGFTPWSKQVEVIESYMRNRRTAVRGCHGAGKDAVLGPLMLYAAYAEEKLVLGVSATERQLLGQLWREVGNRFSSRLPGELLTSELRIGGRQRMVAMTSGKVSSLTGWHDPKGVFIAISEAQGEQVEEAAFDAAIANAVDDASRIVVVGNPVLAAGRFYEVSQKGTWNAIAISALDHPNVVEGRVVIPGGPAPGWPAEMRAEFGADSPWYQSRVLGEFPASGTVDALVRAGWLDAAFARHEALGDGAWWPDAEPAPAAALDVARSIDRDESVMAGAQGDRILSLHAWRSRDLVQTTTRFLWLADHLRLRWHAARQRRIRIEIPPLDRPPTTVEEGERFATFVGAIGPAFAMVIDTPGVGGGCVDEARRRKRSVGEYWGWSPPSPRDDKRFANKRAEVFWHFRKRLEAGVAVLPRDANLREEALAMEWSQDTKGRIVMLSKDELRKTLKRSPDRLDAVVMALGAAARLTGHGPATFSTLGY
jgi:hypothetical protein